MKKTSALFLSLLFTLLIASDIYLFTNILRSNSGFESAVVARVIDGDTLVLDDGRTIRLLNINAPEKDSPLSEKSRSFMQSFQNTSVSIQVVGIDKYSRTLARVYSKDSDYINLELVKQGLASKFLVDSHELSTFLDAESTAITLSKGMWNKSAFFGCFTANIDEQKEVIEIKSSCQTKNMFGWYIKDESRKIYLFKNIAIKEIRLHSSEGKDNETDIFWNSKQDIWNNDRDSMYLFDPEDKIAYYQAYGY